MGGLQVLAGDVDRYRHLCQPLFRPLFEQQADLFKDQQVQLADQPGALAEGDEFARGDQPPPRVDPAHQGLGPCHLGAAVPLPVFGLQVDAELFPGKGLFQLLQALDLLLLAGGKGAVEEGGAAGVLLGHGPAGQICPALGSPQIGGGGVDKTAALAHPQAAHGGVDGPQPGGEALHPGSQLLLGAARQQVEGVPLAAGRQLALAQLLQKGAVHLAEEVVAALLALDLVDQAKVL